MSEIETVTPKQLSYLKAAVMRAHGYIGYLVSGLSEVDLSKGRREVGPYTHHMWTKDKRRIEITATPDCSLMITVSKTPDPECP